MNRLKVITVGNVDELEGAVNTFADEWKCKIERIFQLKENGYGRATFAILHSGGTEPKPKEDPKPKPKRAEAEQTATEPKPEAKPE